MKKIKAPLKALSKIGFKARTGGEKKAHNRGAETTKLM